MEDKKEESLIKKVNPKIVGYCISMGLLFFLLGLIISTQFKTYITIKNSGVPAYRQINELVYILKLTQSKKDDLENQLSQLKHQINDMDKGNTKNISDERLKKIYEAAGLTEVDGNGIIIKLEEPKNAKDNGLYSDDSMVHSDDLLNIVNELRASGAKAISINKHRLVTTSEIITAGNNIVINQEKILPPYVIKVVGPVDTMIATLNLRGGIVENIEVYGIKVNIVKSSDIKIMPFKGNY